MSKKPLRIIIEGEVASGKTTVMEVIHNALEKAGIAHTISSMDLIQEEDIYNRRKTLDARCVAIASKMMVTLEERQLARPRTENKEFARGYELATEGTAAPTFVSADFMRGYIAGMQTLRD